MYGSPDPYILQQIQPPKVKKMRSASPTMNSSNHSPNRAEMDTTPAEGRFFFCYTTQPQPPPHFQLPALLRNLQCRDRFSGHTLDKATKAKISPRELLQQPPFSTPGASAASSPSLRKNSPRPS
ncbi:hypothetical protein Ocin01_15790 [Orchesella cincta]|uniref:Uncharacterized protein n=1 Tax=Orchesella cincta TaxID=48709 RepID=A0A1D2MDA2_ORCCI|nr:hypothetical protein Ocin01_15790 [Orchesella cincta]